MVAIAALGALAAPTLDLRTKAESIEDLGPDMPVVQAYAAIDRAFPSETTPAEVVVKVPAVQGAEFERALAGFRSEVEGSGGKLVGPVDVRVNPAGTVAVVTVGLPADASLTMLRQDVVPATFSRLPGATAGGADFNARLDASLP